MRLLVSLAAIALLPLHVAAATQIVMKNGDRLSGKLLHKRGETLTIETSYAGEVKLRWNEIAEIVSDGPVEVMRRDGSLTMVEFRPGDLARYADIEHINPDAAVAGRGTVYSGRVNVAVNVTDGNSEGDRLYGEVELQARAKQLRYRVNARGLRATQRDELTASNWLLDGQFDRFIAPRRFLYAQATFENDEFRDIRLRSSFGVGFGYQVLDSPDTQLSVDGGPDYVTEDRYVDDDQRYLAAGWGVRYSQWLWSRRLRVFHDQDGFWNMEETDDVVVRTKTGLGIPLVGALQATAQLNLDYDSSPAPGAVSTDQTWLLGVAYTF